MGDPPVEFIRHDGPVPAGLPVTQVYGWLLCPAAGLVLIQEQDDGTFSLPGGTPEPYDAGRDATLTREAFEENQVRISAATAYLGYQEVRQPGRPVIAQLRMAGIITEFAARAPDPDNGRLNRRYMTSLAAAPPCSAGASPPKPRPAPPPKPDASGDCPSTTRPPPDMRTEPVPAQRYASIVAGYAAAVITAVKHSRTLTLNGW